MTQNDFIVIGGGFFGTYIAAYLAKKGKKVVLLEKEDALFKKASFSNQARVHGGYHYPRNLLTGKRSQVLFPRFFEEFKDAVKSNFESYYLIARNQSKVNAKQFIEFCHEINAPIGPASYEVRSFINSDLIEEILKVEEYAFDANILKEMMVHELQSLDIEVIYDTEVVSVHAGDSHEVRLVTKDNKEFSSTQVFNCTYSNLDQIKVENLSPLSFDLKKELTEICIVEPPEELSHFGFTVMCGPFFSFMPFPSLSAYSLTHVRYTPHMEWRSEDEYKIFKEKYSHGYNFKSSFKKMISDAARYIPLIKESKYKESLFEIKTVLSQNENNDGRPIYFRLNYGIDGYHCVLGAKIDNIYDAIEVIDKRCLD